jgi:hypothetical protein
MKKKKKAGGRKEKKGDEEKKRKFYFFFSVFRALVRLHQCHTPNYPALSMGTPLTIRV